MRIGRGLHVRTGHTILTKAFLPIFKARHDTKMSSLINLLLLDSRGTSTIVETFGFGEIKICEIMGFQSSAMPDSVHWQG